MADNRKVRTVTEEEKREAEDFYFYLGSSLQAGRVRAGYKQQDVADLLGTSMNTVSLYERGKTPIKTYDFKRMCDAFGTEPNKLLNYKGPENQSIDYLLMAKIVDMPVADKKKLLDVLNILYPNR